MLPPESDAGEQPERFEMPATAVMGLVLNLPEGAFPSSDQLELLRESHPDLILKLTEAALVGVKEAFSAESAHSQSGAPQDARDDVEERLVLPERLGLMYLADLPGADGVLSRTQVEALSPQAVHRLTFTARVAMRRYLDQARIDVRALPKTSVDWQKIPFDVTQDRVTIEALCHLEQGDTSILTMIALASLRGDQVLVLAERARERIAALMSRSDIQRLVASAVVEGGDVKRTPDFAAISEDYYGLEWLFQMPGRSKILTRQMLDRLPAFVIGMLGAEARAAIIEACANLRIDRREGYDPTDHARRLLDVPHVRRTLERVGASGESYKKGPIDPERDLPPNTVRVVRDPTQLRSVEDVIGLEGPMSRLKPFVYRAKRPDLIETPAEHALLVGYYGVGKSLLAEALARQVLEMNAAEADTSKHVAFVQVNLANIFWKWVGESNANANRLMDFLEQNAPIIVFLDEVEAAMNDPGIAQMHEETLRTQNTILQRISGMTRFRGVTLIGATNRPDLMHQASLRAGRFGRGIIVPLPGTDQLVQMFERKRRVLKVPFEADQAILRDILTMHTFGTRYGDPKGGTETQRTCTLEDAFTGADIDMWMNILAEDHLVRGVEGISERPVTSDVLFESYEQLLYDRSVRRAAIEHRLMEVMHAGATCSINSPAKELYYRNRGTSNVPAAASSEPIADPTPSSAPISEA